MSRIIAYILLASCATSITAQEISVALYYDRKPQGVTLTVQKGSYLVYKDYELVDTLTTGSNINIVKESQYLVYRNRSKAWAIDSDIRIVNQGESAFFINYTGSVEPARCYEGWLKISLADYHIYAINMVSLDAYIAAVVEAQASGMVSEEYFKMQSVISRTWAMQNYGKHSAEGFELCDGSHCQTYKNKATNRVVIKAAHKTSNLVLVDKYKKLISAAYHKNSGGITTHSSFAWNAKDSYLIPVVDSFATQGKSYSWKVLIPAVEWQAYLTKKGMKSADGKLHKHLLIKQDSRISSFKVGNDSIRLATVMADWGWKSSYFTMTLENGVITVKGNGSGHGVGVSQESAILMSQKGYKYDYILKYFYKDIRIININELNIFAEMQTKETKERP